MTQHRTFNPPRLVREYGYVDGQLVAEPGSPSGFLLPWDAIDDQADALVEKRPPMYVVIGEFVRDDGVRFPELGVPTAHIEANSDYKLHSVTRKLRLHCPDPKCQLWDGKHDKNCERGS